MSKIILYQIFTRLFGNANTARIPGGSIEENGCGKLAAFTPEALAAIKELGTTHVWYTGIIEHATQTDYSHFGIRPDHKATVKGKAGSPYAIKDYYDVDPDLATSVPERVKEFENLVKRTHKAGLKVIMDFVPNHVARQYASDAKPEGVIDLGEEDNKDWAFSAQNNFYYIPGTKLEGHIDLAKDAAEPYVEYPAKATGNDRFDAWPDVNDWYETVKLNYGVDYQGGRTWHFDPIPNTWMKMRDILLYWAAKGIDGFRCDMAEMVPCAFWGWVIPQVKEQYPDLIFIAEVYNPNEYRNYIWGGKFDYLYDKVGLYDTLKAVTCYGQSASAITGCWQSLEGIQMNMLNFLENHDEQRFASDFFGRSAKNTFAPLYVSLYLNTSPFMIYFGEEVGEKGMDHEGFSGRDGRTTIFDWWSIESIRRLRKVIAEDAYRTMSIQELVAAGLEEKEAEVFCRFAQATRFASTDPGIRMGTTYDLCYCNFGSEGFDKNRHFAFLRDYQDHTLLVAANFSNKEAEMSIIIPDHAFDWMGIPVNDDIYPGKSIKVTVPPMDGVVVTLI